MYECRGRRMRRSGRLPAHGTTSAYARGKHDRRSDITAGKPAEHSESGMSLDKKQVQRIAHLARLEISDAEAEHYARELSRILGLVEQMNAVETTGVVPMAEPTHPRPPP